MISRLVVYAAAVLIALWWFGRRTRSTAAPAAGAPTVPSGPLVRDRVCNTYLPRERALILREAAGEELFFCSDACLDQYRATSKSPQ